MSWGTLAYGLAVGASLAIAIIALGLAKARGGRPDVELSLALVGLSGAVASLSVFGLQSSASVEEYASAIHGHFAVVGLVTLAALAWLVGAITRQGWPWLPLALTVAAVVVGVVNAATPTGLIVDEVTGLREVSLLGESFVLHEPNRPPLRPILDAYLLALLVYVVGSLVRYGRRGPAFRALAVSLLVLFAAVFYDSLVDEGLVDTAYLTPFGFLLLAAVITIHIATELSRSQRLLASQSAHLEELVATRTRALREAGQRALDDLARKGLVAEQIAEMTRQFIVLGGLPSEEAHGAHFDATLQTIVGRIGVLARARRARLEIAASHGRDELTIEWEAGDAAGREPALLVERELRVGESTLGRLVIWRAPDQPSFSDEEQFVELATQYLAVALHRLALVAALVSTAVDDERQRIARELHDSVSQQLYAAALNADALSKSLEGEDDAATVQRIRALLLSSLAEMRALLFELQPDALEASTITNLIVNLCDSLGTGHPCDVRVRAIAGPSLPPGPKLAIYRIAQEALTNALRHSAASVVSVTIEVDAAGVELLVVDDGAGFEKKGNENGSGLRNMAARADEVGADLAIASQFGSGTTVRVTWARDRFDDVELDLTHADTAEMSTP